MLFILTGDVQIGKTRWLLQLTDELMNAGLACYGVLAPGVWETPPEKEGRCFEKIGIDNVLLPQKKTVAFATRRDIAEDRGTLDPASQSAIARLAWSIPDGALDQVNLHFDAIAAMRANGSSLYWGGDDRGPKKGNAGATPGFLVIDELGRLELQHGQGLSSAVSLLEAGTCSLYEHALIVVREWLYETACQRFAPSWPEIMKIYPTPEDKQHIIEMLLWD